MTSQGGQHTELVMQSMAKFRSFVSQHKTPREKRLALHQVRIGLQADLEAVEELTQKFLQEESGD